HRRRRGGSRRWYFCSYLVARGNAVDLKAVTLQLGVGVLLRDGFDGAALRFAGGVDRIELKQWHKGSAPQSCGTCRGNPSPDEYSGLPVPDRALKQIASAVKAQTRPRCQDEGRGLNP